MRTAARESIQRHVSRQNYLRILSWWRFRLYWKFRIASIFSKRTPIVREFPVGRASDLVSNLTSINVLTPGEMCRVMHWRGSDKSLYKHNYTTIYSALFAGLRSRPLRIFELGLGTDHPTLNSSMGKFGVPGASLRGWKDLFPKATIFGADIDRDILFQEDRISTFYCDQLDRDAINSLWAQPALKEDMDIIIDDGLHTPEANFSFLEGSLRHLRPNGVYIVEDIETSALPKWRDQLEMKYSKQFPNHDFALIEIPHPLNSFDNNMLIIRNRS